MHQHGRLDGHHVQGIHAFDRWFVLRFALIIPFYSSFNRGLLPDHFIACVMFFAIQSWDAEQRFLSLYFLAVIMFLSMFAAQFVLAVLSNSFSDVKRQVELDAIASATPQLQLAQCMLIVV
jgi:hypothetical protein